MLEPALQRLTRSGQIIPLKPKSYDLLCLLVANRDRVVSKEELMDWLWPRQDVGEANLSQTVYELRRALGDSARRPVWIENRPRRGYRFRGDLIEGLPDEAPRGPRSIAVLPFEFPGQAEEDDVIGMGIADAVIDSLGRTRRLVVRPLSAVVRQSSESRADAREVGQRLKVDAVLEGTVQRSGAWLQLDSRLIRVSSGEVLWSEPINGIEAEIYRIQDRIVAGVAKAVDLELTPAEHRDLERPEPRDVQAHALYLKGRYCWYRWTPEAWRQAVDYFEQAIALDPDHAACHAWLGAAWSTLGIIGAVVPHEAFARARRAANRAVALDENLSDGHEIKAAVQMFYDWDLSAALGSLDRAIELNENSSNARHLRALLLAFSGRFAAALAEMENALRADPSSLIANTDRGFILYWGRSHKAACRAFEETLQLEPHFDHARVGLAHALLELGDSAAAEREIRRAFSNESTLAARPGDLAYVLARCGRRGEANAIVGDMEERAGRGALDPWQVMLGRLGLGEADRVFDWADPALERRSRELLVLGVSPISDPIRADARFAALLERAGLAGQIPQ